mmetsp:Transcript_20056/g.29745  ORF Transcript_20056/g.29745 Transcript_20056/m.29745 type:complete len:130 (-) Transcript_20056:1006-1395(-)
MLLPVALQNEVTFASETRKRLILLAASSVSVQGAMIGVKTIRIRQVAAAANDIVTDMEMIQIKSKSEVSELVVTDQSGTSPPAGRTLCVCRRQCQSQACSVGGFDVGYRNKATSSHQTVWNTLAPTGVL